MVLAGLAAAVPEAVAAAVLRVVEPLADVLGAWAGHLLLVAVRARLCGTTLEIRSVSGGEAVEATSEERGVAAATAVLLGGLGGDPVGAAPKLAIARVATYNSWGEKGRLQKFDMCSFSFRQKNQFVPFSLLSVGLGWDASKLQN